MNAPEAVEQGLIERLHPHRDAVYAAGPEQFGFVERYGGRVAFHRPLPCPAQAEPLHRAEDSLPLPQVQERGCAAAKEDRARPQVGCHQFQLTDERAHVALDQFAAGSLGVEGAIESTCARRRAHGHRDLRSARQTDSAIAERSAPRADGQPKSLPLNGGTPPGNRTNGLRRVRALALDVLGLGSLFACHNVEDDLLALVQRLETSPRQSPYDARRHPGRLPE